MYFPRTHCVNGHEWATYGKRYKNGRLKCMECQRVCSRKYSRKHKPKSKNTKNRNSPKVSRRHALLSKYGLTLEAFDELLESQLFCCAICKTTNWGQHNRPHVDHDHATGKVRGLLCLRCNVGIGMLNDDPSLLSIAITYLSHHTDWRGS